MRTYLVNMLHSNPAKKKKRKTIAMLRSYLQHRSVELQSWQKILGKSRKSSNIGQQQKTLISGFS